jgi:lysophospholipase L1-like esterase
MLRISLILALAATACAQKSAPADRRCLTNEKLKLAAEAPRSWSRGTVLPALAFYTKGVVPAPDAFDAKSLVIRHGDLLLELGRDYLVDPVWGTLGLAPGSRVTKDDTVSVDFCYALRRVDALVRERGQERVIPGQPALTDPLPPAIPKGARHVANLYLPYFATSPEVFPIEKSTARTASRPGFVPRTLRKLQTGQPVKIVSWGDSVTTGADVTAEESYTAVFEQLLRAKFPRATIQVEPVAVGGSQSRQWLYPDRFPTRLGGDQLRWQRVLDAKPDLVTIEFVNDASLKPDEVRQVYTDILTRLRAIGAEVILITPHFTMLSMMQFKTLRDQEARPYVLTLRDFARENRLALADASARWEHLWREGIPYVTLLRNGINHPDPRGHRLFAEELLKCF